MTIQLTDLINEHYDSLVDEITKDAIRQIGAYGEAPLRQTVERIERSIKVLADSVRLNEPDILQEFITVVAAERQKEGYSAAELHAIVAIMKQHVQRLITRTYDNEVERTGYLALADTIMESARMIISVAYLPQASEE
jgi:ribosome-binding protein aMBF1 (putative translation factor)